MQSRTMGYGAGAEIVANAGTQEIEAKAAVTVFVSLPTDARMCMFTWMGYSRGVAVW